MESFELCRVNDGGETDALILPGWATDFRVFRPVSADYNLVSTRSFLPDHYVDEVAEYLQQECTSPVPLIGWSLGAYAATALARRFPDRVSTLILVGARDSYPDGEIQAVQDALEADREGCLRRFYRECFLPTQKDDYKRFRSDLMDTYLDEMRTGLLIEGLQYLGARSLVIEKLPDCDIIFVHGEQDVVAPVDSAMRLAESNQRARMEVLPETGHAAFLSPDFQTVLSDD